MRRLELPALLKVHPLSLSTESSTKARQNFFLLAFSHFSPFFFSIFPVFFFFSFFFGLPSSLILSTQMQNNYFTFSLVFRFTAPLPPTPTLCGNSSTTPSSPPPPALPSFSSWGNPFAGSGCRNLCTFPSSFYLFFAFFFVLKIILKFNASCPMRPVYQSIYPTHIYTYTYIYLYIIYNSFGFLLFAVRVF